MNANLPPDVLALLRAEFDSDFYLAANKDVADAGADPFEHFMLFGGDEGRDPRSDFSMRRYLDLNLDVKDAGVNAFVHWITAGRREGRTTDHGLGFRFETLWSGKPIEARLHDLRMATPDRPPNATANLTEALADLTEDRAVHFTVSHDDYTRGVGGVQLCIRLEADALRVDGRDHIHLFPGAPSVVVDVERESPTLGVVVNGALAGFFAHSEVAAVFAPRMKARPTSLAIHSMIGHAPTALMSVIQAMGMSSAYYWLHDFSSLCAGYALMRNDVAFCGAPPIDSAACEICTYGRRRRIQVAAHVALFQALEITMISPSRSALDLWKTRFPVQPERMLVHPHASIEPRQEAARGGLATGSPLRVAFLGMPTLHKGWPIFAELASRFADDPRYEFHHFSAIQDPRVPAKFTRVAPTTENPQPMIPMLEELAVDIVLVWSLWPETFCFAALEGLAAGAALVTNPLAGNVVDIATAAGAAGRVIANEDRLSAFFATGEALALARAGRAPTLGRLNFSRMSADLILEQTT